MGLVMKIETKGKLCNEEKEKKKTDVRTHCGRTGHYKRNCSDIIGYPDWLEERPQNENKSGGRSQQTTRSFRGRRGTPCVNVVHTSIGSNGRSQTLENKK